MSTSKGPLTQTDCFSCGMELMLLTVLSECLEMILTDPLSSFFILIEGVPSSGRNGRQGCRRPVRPARSACQAEHLAWPGRLDRDLTGRQVGIHPLIIINYSFILQCICNNSYFNQLVMVTIYKLQIQKLSLRYITCSDANSALAI